MKIKIKTQIVRSNVQSNHTLFTPPQNIQRLLCSLKYQEGEFNDPITAERYTPSNWIYVPDDLAFFLPSEIEIVEEDPLE